MPVDNRGHSPAVSCTAAGKSGTGVCSSGSVVGFRPSSGSQGRPCTGHPRGFPAIVKSRPTLYQRCGDCVIDVCGGSSHGNSHLLWLADRKKKADILGLSVATTALTRVKPLLIGCSQGFLAQAGSDNKRPLNGRLLAQVEVWRLAMAKSAARSLSAIVGGFPVGMTQELAQVGKPSRRQMFLARLERCGRICRLSAPGFEAGLGFSDRTLLLTLIGPEPIPVDQKSTGAPEVAQPGCSRSVVTTASSIALRCSGRRKSRKRCSLSNSRVCLTASHVIHGAGGGSGSVGSSGKLAERSASAGNGSWSHFLTVTRWRPTWRAMALSECPWWPSCLDLRQLSLAGGLFQESLIRDGLWPRSCRLGVGWNVKQDEFWFLLQPAFNRLAVVAGLADNGPLRQPLRRQPMHLGDTRPPHGSSPMPTLSGWIVQVIAWWLRQQRSATSHPCTGGGLGNCLRTALITSSTTAVTRRVFGTEFTANPRRRPGSRS